MKIYGNTVGTTLPKPDWNQEDPSKGDYIKNKPSALDGTTYTPSVDAEGNLSWSNDGGLENPETVNIMGPEGPEGPQGAKGDAGTDGYTPVKGTDYYTDADKEEMVESVLDAVPKASGISVDRNGSTTTMTVTMGDGTKSTLVIEYGANGDPAKITADGVEVGIEFVYHILYLYNKGDACDSAHGGWVASTRMYSTNAKAPTLTLGTDSMKAAITDTTLNFESGIVETADGVDLTPFQTLTFVVTGYSLSNANGDAAIRVGITDDLTDTAEFDAMVPVTGKGAYTLDVSAYSGVHDILIYLKTDVGAGNKASITLSEIYLE